MFSSFDLFINGSGASFDFSNCPWSVSKVGDGFCDDADTTNVPGKAKFVQVNHAPINSLINCINKKS